MQRKGGKTQRIAQIRKFSYKQTMLRRRSVQFRRLEDLLCDKCFNR